MSGHGTVVSAIDKQKVAEQTLASVKSGIISWRGRKAGYVGQIDGLHITDDAKKKIVEQLVNLHHEPPPTGLKLGHHLRRLMSGPKEAKDYMLGTAYNQEDRPRFSDALDRLDSRDIHSYHQNVLKAFQDELDDLNERQVAAKEKIKFEFDKMKAADPTKLAQLTADEKAAKDVIDIEAKKYSDELTAQRAEFHEHYSSYVKNVIDKRENVSEDDRAALDLLQRMPWAVNPDETNIELGDLDLNQPGKTLGKLIKNNGLRGYYTDPNKPDGTIMMTGPVAMIPPPPGFLKKLFPSLQPNDWLTFVPGRESVKMMYDAKDENGKPIGVKSIWMNQALKDIYMAKGLGELDANTATAFDAGMAVASAIIRWRMDSAYEEIQRQERKIALKAPGSKFDEKKFMDFVKDNGIDSLAKLHEVVSADDVLRDRLRNMGVEVHSPTNIKIVDPEFKIKKIDGFPPDGTHESSNPRFKTKQDELDHYAERAVRKQDRGLLIGLIKNAREKLVADTTAQTAPTPAVAITAGSTTTPPAPPPPTSTPGPKSGP